MNEDEGGRIFFARPPRAPDRDAEIDLVSVGVDIGSSTSHLVFSRLSLARGASRTRLLASETLYDGEILLTPYAEGESIDIARLGRFIRRQYDLANVDPEMIDTGALILTGTAAGKRNAAAIGALFAGVAGRFVAVTAGDALETTLAAYGSGAVVASREEGVAVMNIDIGGGTSKIARCIAGAVTDITALDIGARLVVLDTDGAVARIESAALALAADARVTLVPGEVPQEGALVALAELMAARLYEAVGGAELSAAARALHRLPPLRDRETPGMLSFSGGVAEYIYGREGRRFGDLGPLLADAVLARMRNWGPALHFGSEGIRATVVGASQHTVQISGTTIVVDPPDVLPLHGLAVLAPDLPLDGEALDPDAIAGAISKALGRLDLTDAETPVALYYRFRGPATHARLDALCRGIGRGLAGLIARGLPLVLVGKGDIAGLVGLHCRAELELAVPIVSIDGIELREFDTCDIGLPLDLAGALPVVIKSLIFPVTAPREATPDA
jgi:ethanolamine utilization protein EutA